MFCRFNNRGYITAFEIRFNVTKSAHEVVFVAQMSHDKRRKGLQYNLSLNIDGESGKSKFPFWKLDFEINLKFKLKLTCLKAGKKRLFYLLYQRID